jgi:hypothetical protein
LVTAPVPPRTWGHGVPGELLSLPGIAHSYRLRAIPVPRSTFRPGESAPPRNAHSFARSLFALMHIASFPTPSGTFPPQISQAKKNETRTLCLPSMK